MSTHREEVHIRTHPAPPRGPLARWLLEGHSPESKAHTRKKASIARIPQRRPAIHAAM